MLNQHRFCSPRAPATGLLTFFIAGEVLKSFSLDSLLIFQTYVDPTQRSLRPINAPLRLAAMKVAAAVLFPLGNRFSVFTQSSIFRLSECNRDVFNSFESD